MGAIARAAFLALALCQAPVSQAQEPVTAPPADNSDAPALWEFRFAAFGRYAPVYPGAEESDLTLLPLPIPVYRGSFL